MKVCKNCCKEIPEERKFCSRTCNALYLAKNRCGIKHSEERRRKNSESHKGKKVWNTGLTKENNETIFKQSLHPSYKNKERNEKIRNSKLGKKRVFNDEWRKNLAIANIRLGKWKGKNNPSFGKKGNESHSWKGGPLLAIARTDLKRRQLGYDTLNERFEGSCGHHIDHIHVVFIPEQIHISVHHALKNVESMERINTLAFCWLLGVDYIRA